MKKCIIFAYILIFLRVTKEDDPPEPEDNNFIDWAYSNMTEFIQQRILYGVEEAKKVPSNFSEKCYEIFNDAYSETNSTKTSMFITKFITDSSKSKNDLGSYTECLNSVYKVNNYDTSEITNNVTYIIINLRTPVPSSTIIDLNYTTGRYMFGACVPKGCAEDEYLLIFYHINKNLSIFENLSEQSEIQVYDLLKDWSSEISFWCNLTIIIICFVILWSIITIIPQFLLYVFLIGRTDNIKEKIKFCFKFTENSEELMGNGSNITSNDTGLSSFKGIRGITMVFYLISIVFLQIFINPNRIYQPELFVDFASQFSFSVVLYGIRFGPRIFYAISGFILVFKMLHHLDNQVDIIEEKERLVDVPDNSVNSIGLEEQKPLENLDNLEEEEIEKPNNTRDSFIENAEQPVADLDELMKEANNKSKGGLGKLEGFSYDTEQYNKYHHLISISVLWKFIFRTTYKYLMLICVLFHFKYTIIDMTLRTLKPSMPIMCYFHHFFSSKFEFIKHILSHLLFFYGYSKELYFQYDPFIVPCNEMFFFIICSALIYFSYKHNWRLDIIVILLFVIFQGGKAILYVLINKTERIFFPAMVYQENEVSFILHNPLYNFPSYLIGIFFGLTHYCIQNSSKASGNKNFLKIPKNIFGLLSMKKCAKFVLGAISIIMFILNAFGFSISILAYYDETNKIESIRYFYNKQWVEVLAMYDTEIGIFFLLFFIIQLFLVGDNIVFDFLNNQYWNIFSRPYHINMLIIYSLSFYIFFLSENKIKIDLLNILFFAVIIFIVTILQSIAMFIFIEIPLKKFNKLVLYVDDYEKKQTKKEM